MDKKKEAGALAAAGSASAVLTAIGALNLCCVPAVVVFLGIFGVTSAFLSAYNWIFIVLSVILFSAAVIIYKRSPKRCKVRK